MIHTSPIRRVLAVLTALAALIVLAWTAAHQRAYSDQPLRLTHHITLVSDAGCAAQRTPE